ncbi:hypothetical protein NMS_0158 [Nonlabens marinus S1-08]|uniref:Uncharacterized protein n=1 Tax=Nonlabens marinus S1-08 TaxID=1454201 RepID=W8VVT7_9FLAO|nr:hypothetical protein NMS_0158 [Nonlabens marinus S1-08]
MQVIDFQIYYLCRVRFRESGKIYLYFTTFKLSTILNT